MSTRCFSKLLLLVVALCCSRGRALAQRRLGADSAFTWVEDPHAADACEEAAGCVNHVKYGYNVVPMNVSSDANIVMQTAERPAGLSAIVLLATYTQPGCRISGCHSVKALGLFSLEEYFNEKMEKTANQPDGESALINFGGIYYEHLPEGELYVKYERKNYLTGESTCTYEVRSGYKRWF